MSSVSPEVALAAGKDFVSFVNKACTPFHAVKVVSDILDTAGYTQLDERKVWPEMLAGGKYYLARNETSLVAFALGGKFKPENGIKIVGAHTDSPNFALKPHTLSNSDKYRRVAVQCYGGGLWHTWFDRDLTVAGRLVISNNGKMESRLVRIDKPLMRIPTLAIHLCSASERAAFAPDKEKHLIPVIATELAETLNKSAAPEDKDTKQCAVLFKAIADAAKCNPEDIIDFDLSVIDTQPAAVGGVANEFIFAPRIDNLLSCFCAIKAMTDATELANDTMGRLVCLFDHEEVGSESSPGAGGSLIPDIIEHLIQQHTLRATLVANSFLLSVDCAHASHPNYSDKHEQHHRPNLHAGPVIKYNANQRYATNGYTAAVLKSIAKAASVPLQEFVVKNDSPCGTTIGPVLSTLSGIKTIDIGNAMLSMHSIREMCGTVDVEHLTQLIKAFFDKFDIVV